MWQWQFNFEILIIFVNGILLFWSGDGLNVIRSLCLIVQSHLYSTYYAWNVVLRVCINMECSNGVYGMLYSVFLVYIPVYCWMV